MSQDCGYIAKMSVDPGVYRIQHQNTSAVIGVSVYGFNALILHMVCQLVWDSPQYSVTQQKTLLAACSMEKIS